jgi:hypothetical protein
MMETYLNWQRLAQEFLEEVFFGSLAHQYTNRIIIFNGSIRSSHHLQDVSDRVVLISVDLNGFSSVKNFHWKLKETHLSIVALRIHDDNQMSRNICGPAKASCHNCDLDGAGVKELLHDSSVGCI